MKRRVTIYIRGRAVVKEVSHARINGAKKRMFAEWLLWAAAHENAANTEPRRLTEVLQRRKLGSTKRKERRNLCAVRSGVAAMFG
jgi:hypothetical protein